MKFQKSLQMIILVELLVPLSLLILGVYHGVIQVLSRAGVIRAARVAGMDYYQGLTAHGTVNAVVLTTFFAVALGHAFVSQELGAISILAAGSSLILMLLGACMVIVMIYSGQASVLYTFYPPLKAHPLFYLALVLLIVGSWLAFYAWIPVYLRWRKNNPEKKTPLAAVGMLSTFTIWQIATLPLLFEILVLLLPWSLGWTEGVNVLLCRTLFWFFGHPLVYFWLLPTYTLYYTLLPRLAGGKLYSDFAGRFSFLVFIVFSSPLGLHHQYADPGISSQWKGLHAVLTSIVVLPSLMTAFTLAASLELGARMRGGKGLFSWWKKLPYFSSDQWLFSYLFSGLLIFIFGGMTGLINASFSMNNVVHNTAWIPAHFHLTVGGPVFLGILGMSLFLITGILKKPILSLVGVHVVPYAWMGGTFLFSSGLFWGGLQGEPRRTNLGLTYLNPESPSFRPEWVMSTGVTLIGGLIMALAMFIYFGVLIQSLRAKPRSQSEEFMIPLSVPFHDEDVPAVKNFTPWIIAALLVVVVAYYPPLVEILKTETPHSPPYRPDLPIPIPRGVR